MRYILDTGWIINLLAGKKDAAEYIQRFDPEDIGISLVQLPKYMKAPLIMLIRRSTSKYFARFLGTFNFLP